MTTAEMKIESGGIIHIRNWRAVPTTMREFQGVGYDIYHLNDYRGYAATKEAATKWLEDSSGVTYDNLPAIKQSDLIVETGKWNRCSEFPNRGRKYRHTFYYFMINGEKKMLGKIQLTGSDRSGYTSLTSANECCVRGSDVEWLCRENGYRLTDG